MFNFSLEKIETSKNSDPDKQKTGFIKAWINTTAKIVLKDSSGKINKTWYDDRDIELELPVGSYEITVSNEKTTIMQDIEVIADNYVNITFTL